jgi:hypothetical protein
LIQWPEEDKREGARERECTERENAKTERTQRERERERERESKWKL